VNREEIIRWLKENDQERLTQLWHWADTTRAQFVGDEVYLRGLVELSNHCVRLCAYCGLRAPNRNIARYRMTAAEVLDCARQAVAFGYGTLVLQAGEDLGITRAGMADLIRKIKEETPLAVTLSLGERTEDELQAWREAGADRYLLRFETSNRTLYDRLHPPRPDTPSDRLALLRQIRQLGYEVGSGMMIGLPGQTFDDVAGDIEAFRELELDMIGVGPFLAHPDTPLGDPAHPSSLPADEQVPPTELMTYKVIALTRLACPRANIPSTTALATLNRHQGRELGLKRGANIVMPNLTPARYRVHYEIYPNKACIQETADACSTCMEWRIRGIGRSLGAGRGDSPNFQCRQPEAVTE